MGILSIIKTGPNFLFLFESIHQPVPLHTTFISLTSFKFLSVPNQQDSQCFQPSPASFAPSPFLSFPLLRILTDVCKNFFFKKRKHHRGNMSFFKKIPENKWRLSCYHWWGGTYPLPGTRSLRVEGSDDCTFKAALCQKQWFCVSEPASGRQWSREWCRFKRTRRIQARINQVDCRFLTRGWKKTKGQGACNKGRKQRYWGRQGEGERILAEALSLLFSKQTHSPSHSSLITNI